MNQIENQVGETLQAMKSVPTLKRCYNKLPLPKEQIKTLLCEDYCQEVKRKSNRQIEPVKQVGDIATWLNRDSLKPWLILYGVIGNGKSTMAHAIRALYARIKRISCERLKNRWKLSNRDQAFYEHLKGLAIPEIYSAMEIAALASSDSDGFNLFKRVPILIIDDMGLEALKVLHYGTEISPVAEVLYHRYDKRMMTIITSNKDFNQLCETYGERLADRFHEVASRIGFTSKSYRR